MRTTLALGLATVTLAGGAAALAPTAASADCTSNNSCATTTTTVTGVVGGTGLTGVRTFGTVGAVTLAGASSLAGSLTVPVVETTAVGVNPWSVTASSTALTSGSNSIAASNLKVSDTTVPAGVGCLLLTSPCTVAGGGATPRSLDTAQTLFSVSGESASSAYTGTYTYVGNLGLTVPNGTPVGTYQGTLTLTLVQ